MINLDTKIIQEGDFVIIKDDKAKKEDLRVEIMNYGDHVYDVHIAFVPEDRLFGGFSICGINGMKKAREFANHLAKEAGLPKSKIVVLEVDEDDF